MFLDVHKWHGVEDNLKEICESPTDEFGVSFMNIFYNKEATPDTINPGQSAPYDLAVGYPYASTVPVILIDHVKFHLGWRDSNHPF